MALKSDVPSGHGPDWASSLKSSDYELLCPDGTKVPVRDWQRCHLVRIPLRGIVVGNHVTPASVLTMLQDGKVRPHSSPGSNVVALFEFTVSSPVSGELLQKKQKGRMPHSTSISRKRFSTTV